MSAHYNPRNTERYDHQRALTSEEAEKLFAMIADRSDWSVELLRSKRRWKELVRVRAAFVWIARTAIHYTPLRNPGPDIPASYAVLAGVLGMDCHSSVMNLLKRANEMRERDSDYRELLDGWLGEWRSGNIAPTKVALYERPIGPPVRLIDLGLSACRKPKNDISPDDSDARNRLRGTAGLIAAIRREHPERFVA